MPQDLPDKAKPASWLPSSDGQDWWNSPNPFELNGNDLGAAQAVLVIAAITLVLWAGFFGLIWALRPL